MRRIGVNTNGPTPKGLAELNHHMQDEAREVRNGVGGEGQGQLAEDESKTNNVAGDENSRCVAQVQVVVQRQQQQPQGPMVIWERFLPVRSLRVLLVENDDSTRHVVSALLRNCSYEVTAVTNGLEAWEILEDPTKHIDLILTEVVMPFLSGVGLLSKIMSHRTCKNIPLIMMSSNDSMGIVFKCLSKGAVDFLVKPIRKNELKNLWQHVWRKCHSSSLSGSESGIRSQKPSRSRSIEGSDNNTGSNDEDDNWSSGLNVKDGSDNGSGTQSSWSKRAVEVDSTQPMTQWDQNGDPPDSTCAQVIHSRPEAFENCWVPKRATKEFHQEFDGIDNVSMGKYMEVGVPKNSDLRIESATGTNKIFNLESTKDGKKLEKRRVEHNIEAENGELRDEASDHICVITNSTNAHMQSVTNEDELPKVTNIKDKATDQTKELLYLELELKTIGDGDNRINPEVRNVLRHSDLSAFSRYNTTSNANQAPTGNVGSCSPPENSSGATKTRSMHNIESNSNGIPNQRSNGSSNNDMGSTTNNIYTKLETLNDKTISKSFANTHPCSAFQSVQHNHISSIQTDIQGKADVATSSTVLAARTAHQQVQVQHHHHHYHHHHHHVHNMQQQSKLSDHDNLSFRNMDTPGSHYGPSNLLTVPTKGNAADYNLNRSASGSNTKSQGENGSSEGNGNNAGATDEGDEGTNMASDNGVAGKCRVDNGNGSGSNNGIDQNRSAIREAALKKFRQKRKDRCFEKKVRYQSRKRLAEQRPRVRGQFVRQTVSENKADDPNS